MRVEQAIPFGPGLLSYGGLAGRHPYIRAVVNLVLARAVVAVLELLHVGKLERRTGEQLVARKLDILAYAAQRVGVRLQPHRLALPLDEAQDTRHDARHGAKDGDGHMVVAFGRAEDDEDGGNGELQDHYDTLPKGQRDAKLALHSIGKTKKGESHEMKMKTRQGNALHEYISTSMEP